MKIAHFSDWHANFRALPEADLYVCTGDMLPNWCVRTKSSVDPWFAHGIERERQADWIHRFNAEGGFERYVPDPSVPIVCVRGNHDFIPIGGLFERCNLVHEFSENEAIEVLGRRVTGHRGIPHIFGSWNDEVHRPDLGDRMRSMPLADIYLTHYPPMNVLDSERPDAEGWADLGEHYGLEGMADFLLYRGDRMLHCFGHIHECGGRTRAYGTATFSNAACTINVVDVTW